MTTFFVISGVILWIIVIFKLIFIITYYHMRIGAPMIKGTPGSGKAFRTVPSLTGEILEKNGFVKMGDNISYHLKYTETNGDFVHIGIELGLDKLPATIIRIQRARKENPEESDVRYEAYLEFDWIINVFDFNAITSIYHLKMRLSESLDEYEEINITEEGKSTIDDYFTSDTNRSFIRWSIDKMLSDEFNRKWKYNEYNESSIKLIRLGAFDGYHQAIIDILTFIHTNMSDEELHNPLVWKSCMFINYFGKWAPMLVLCNKLNTLLFEKTEENEKKIKQLIRENITEHPERKIFYDENLYSEDKSLEAVIRKKSMFFVPTEDQKFSPGIIVKYRKKEH